MEAKIDQLRFLWCDLIISSLKAVWSKINVEIKVERQV